MVIWGGRRDDRKYAVRRMMVVVSLSYPGLGSSPTQHLPELDSFKSEPNLIEGANGSNI